jgi:hypothetical protein
LCWVTLPGSSRLILVGLATLTGSSRLTFRKIIATTHCGERQVDCEHLPLGHHSGSCCQDSGAVATAMSECILQGQSLVRDGTVQHTKQLLECRRHGGILVVGVDVAIIVASQRRPAVVVVVIAVFLSILIPI